MQTYRTTVPLREDKTIHLEIPCDLPPGPVEVLVVMERKPQPGQPASPWDELDPQEWIEILRSGTDITPYLERWQKKTAP